MTYIKAFIVILLVHISISCGPDESSSINAACESSTDKTKSDKEIESQEKAALYEGEEALHYEGEEVALYEGEEAEETDADTKKKSSESDTCTATDKENKAKSTIDTKDTKD